MGKGEGGGGRGEGGREGGSECSTPRLTKKYYVICKEKPSRESYIFGKVGLWRRKGGRKEGSVKGEWRTGC